MSTFSELPLLPSLLESLAEQGFTRPTEIQAQTLQPLSSGRSLVGVSETGSGKTLAYVLPMLHQLKSMENAGSAVSEPGRPRGLVVVPGRELGEQVSKVIKSLTHRTRLRSRIVIGGSAKAVARQSVKGKFELLVATPGRLAQLLDSGELRLDDVRMLVFDEADQVLDAGFLPVAKRIVGECPSQAQLVLFSATVPQSLERAISTVFAKAPLQVRTQGSQKVVRTLTTDNRVVERGRRLPLVRSVIAEHPTMGTMLFANTREQCDKVAAWLETEGLAFVNFRGEMDRQERRKNLARFRSGDVSLLLTTDLGGRGLDIERVERVINVHLPADVDNYLHRVGRTARAGRPGTVVNLVTERDQPLMDKLQKRANKRG
ncbi:MAG: ATP-dependent RNA helicase RhlE [Kiritimatiellia bacterium]